jgi:ABC-type taurine transport system ATPase subunit
LRVRPDGVVRAQDGDAVSVAVRDRLNALLSSMIHQHKKIVLLDLHELSDGTFAATVIVNDANVASDPILLELREKSGQTVR